MDLPVILPGLVSGQSLNFGWYRAGTHRLGDDAHYASSNTTAGRMISRYKTVLVKNSRVAILSSR